MIDLEGVPVSDYPNDSCGDVAYWGLGGVQAAGYHARLSRMHANTSARFADLAVRYARRAVIGSRVSAVFAVAAIALTVTRLVVGP